MNRSYVTRHIFSIGLIAFPLASIISATLSAQTTATTEIKRLVQKAQQEKQRKQYDAAIRDLSLALSMHPNVIASAETLSRRSSVYLAKEELTKAMADAEEAVRIAPTYFRGYEMRGRILRKTGQTNKAIQEFDTAIKLAPQVPQISGLYNTRGNTYSLLGLEERAIRDYTEAIHREPRSIDGYVNRGGSYTTLKQFDKAITDLSVAISINPRDSDSYHNRGQAYEGKHDYLSALSDYKKALKISPRDPGCLSVMAWIRATCPVDSLRNGEEALEKSTEACRLTDWKNAYKLDTLAAAYAEVGNFERAVHYQTAALKLKIDSRYRGGMEGRLGLYRNRTAYRDM